MDEGAYGRQILGRGIVDAELLERIDVVSAEKRLDDGDAERRSV